MKRFKVLQSYFALFILTLSVLLLAGCGSGGNDAAPGVADTTAPTVISTAPAAGATDVPTDRKISATFSEAMLASTITAVGTFTVQNTSIPGPVAGIVTYNAINHITIFTPNAPLPASSNFTATIITAAKDSAGKALAVAKTWVFSTGAGTDTTNPTVSITIPDTGAFGVLRNANITATFSEVMDQETITQITFTVKKKSDLSAVAGTVTYLGSTATFKPSSNLEATVEYTAEITTGAKDLAGNPLASGGLATNAWNFTTGAVAGGNPRAPVLGETARFVILASQKVTTTVGSLIYNGDIGIEDQARSYYEGFTPGANPGQFVELTNGLSYAHDDTNPALIPAGYASTIAFINQVRTDLGIANTFLATDPNPDAPTQVCPIQLGNLTLTRGVYKTAVNVSITTGDLYLDAEGDSNSVWIFSIDGTLTTGAPSGNIILANGALAKNIYWRTGGLTTIGPGTAFYGNVFAWSQVNVLAGAGITGRLFALTDQVTLIADTVTKAP